MYLSIYLYIYLSIYIYIYVYIYIYREREREREIDIDRYISSVKWSVLAHLKSQPMGKISKPKSSGAF